MNRQKTIRPRPPDKGSFPLDHEGECKDFMKQYMQCLKRSGYDNGLCRSESKAYLRCRMERELMAQEDFKKLGFHDNKPHDDERRD